MKILLKKRPDIYIVSKFAWFPILIKGEIRWLERVKYLTKKVRLKNSRIINYGIIRPELTTFKYKRIKIMFVDSNIENVFETPEYLEFKNFYDVVENHYYKTQSNKRYIINGHVKIQYDVLLKRWCVDVDGDVDFYGLNIDKIPFQFRNVSGEFKCSECRNLTSLKGCPVYVGYNFECNSCKKLTSLEYCPKEVGGSFWCEYTNEKFNEDYVRMLCKVNNSIHL